MVNGIDVTILIISTSKGYFLQYQQLAGFSLRFSLVGGDFQNICPAQPKSLGDNM